MNAKIWNPDPEISFDRDFLVLEYPVHCIHYSIVVAIVGRLISEVDTFYSSGIKFEDQVSREW